MTKKTAVTIFLQYPCCLAEFTLFSTLLMMSLPPSKRLYDPENKYPKKQKELQNQSYFLTDGNRAHWMLNVPPGFAPMIFFQAKEQVATAAGQ